MKILSINLARSIWLFPMVDYNPTGKSLYAAMPFLIDLYNFRKFPSIDSIPNLNDGLKFEDGDYENEKGNILALNLTVYNDGVIVDTRSSTNDCDNFLDITLSKLSEKYDLPKYDQILRKKIYVSQLHVTTDKTLNSINPKLINIYKHLSSKTGEEYSLGGIHIFPDQTAKITPPPFTFERAIGVPFSEKRYYTTAGLPTDEHIELLEEIESILSE